MVSIFNHYMYMMCVHGCAVHEVLGGSCYTGVLSQDPLQQTVDFSGQLDSPLCYGS